MPYIKQKEREDFALAVEAILNAFIDRHKSRGKTLKAGHLNYLLTKTVHVYLNLKGLNSYQNMNDVVGALESAKAEFQRRVVAPYEDKKIEENGDL